MQNLVLSVKSEARNPKSETISSVKKLILKREIAKLLRLTFLYFGDSDFGFVSDFDIRI